MKYISYLIVSFILLLSQGLNAHGVELVVHPDEKPHLLKLIKRLGLSEDAIHRDNRKGESKNHTEFGREFGNYKDRFWFDGKVYQHLLYVTDYESRIKMIRVKEIDFANLYEIKNFKNLVWLDIHNTNIEDIEGVEKLVNLEKLELGGSDSLKDLNGLNAIKGLRYVNLDGSNNVADISGMEKLPSLEEFYCHNCNINDVTPLAKFTNLKKLKLAGKFKDISSLKSLKKLEYLYLSSEKLESFDVVNDMPSLDELFVWKSGAKDFKIYNKLPNLLSINIVSSPIRSAPDVVNTPNLWRFSLTSTNVERVDFSVNKKKLKKVELLSNSNLKEVTGINNMPLLQEFSLSKSPVKNIEFGPLPSLKKLTLSGTNITEIKGFDHFPELTELWMRDTKVKNLEPLLDAPKLHRVMLDKTARDIPNVMLILDVLGDNLLAHHRKGGPQDARKVYEQRLAGEQTKTEEAAEEQKSRPDRRSRN